MKKDILWQAIKVETEHLLDSNGYDYTKAQLNTITDGVMNDDYVWQKMNEWIQENIDTVISLG